ncbi:hypothetical protein [uncultured Desulfosarcina sp.]|uniref:hypothetical protein n=1 Tax=uncultured Desulfosarcina sp. TaxID=218289 RepID=UPI0029C71E82|nr:hypothetical protein [uncultured Desulfosarcina sp.]
MIKRAKLTLDSDPLESNSTPSPTPPDEEEIKEAVKTTPEKESSLLRTIIFAGLTIASLIVFKRKLF